MSGPALAKVVSRLAVDILRDAERQPDGWVVFAWIGELPVYLAAQDILKAGRKGIHALCAEFMSSIG